MTQNPSRVGNEYGISRRSILKHAIASGLVLSVPAGTVSASNDDREQWRNHMQRLRENNGGISDVSHRRTSENVYEAEYTFADGQSKVATFRDKGNYEMSIGIDSKTFVLVITDSDIEHLNSKMDRVRDQMERSIASNGGA